MFKFSLACVYFMVMFGNFGCFEEGAGRGVVTENE